MSILHLSVFLFRSSFKSSGTVGCVFSVRFGSKLFESVKIKLKVCGLQPCDEPPTGFSEWKCFYCQEAKKLDLGLFKKTKKQKTFYMLNEK